MKRIIIFVLIIIGFSVQNVNGQTVRRQKEDAISFKEFLEKEEAKKQKGTKRRQHIEQQSPVVKEKNTYRREVVLNLGNSKPPFFERRWVKNTGWGLLGAAVVTTGYLLLKHIQSNERGPAGVPGNGPSGTSGNGP